MPTSPRQSVRKNLDFEPLSTTALILEDRPAYVWVGAPAGPAHTHLLFCVFRVYWGESHLSQVETESASKCLSPPCWWEQAIAAVTMGTVQGSLVTWCSLSLWTLLILLICLRIFQESTGQTDRGVAEAPTAVRGDGGPGQEER